jgi:hypothetical protein
MAGTIRAVLNLAGQLATAHEGLGSLAAGAAMAARAYDPAVIGASWNDLLADHRPHVTQETRDARVT